MDAMGARARAAAETLRLAPAEQRSAAIAAAGAALRARSSAIFDANAADMAAATNLEGRLRLDDEGLEAISSALHALAVRPDGIGEEMERWSRPNGLDIARVRTPIGVIGMIYESRPNVTADAAAICLRSANALILRPGSQALRSCLAIHGAIAAGLADSGLPEDCIQIVPTSDRDAVGMMLEGLAGAIDLLIPRGGAALVERVVRDSKVPVLGHLEGLCHSYVHSSADLDMALRIVADAKMRRTSVCGATETLLVDRAIAPALLPRLAGVLGGCELRGDAEARRHAPMEAAVETGLVD